MPYEYNTRSKKFVGVSKLEVRAEIDKLLDHVEREFARLGKSYSGKLISAAEFEAEMQGLLRSAHIVAASVGKGGRALMTLADWGRVGAKIRWQYGYLSKFTRKISRGILSEAAVANRARMYASAVFVSFSDTYKEAQTKFVEGGKNPVLARLVTNSKEGCEECAADEDEGWVSVDDIKPIGTRICGDFCKCDIEFSTDEGEQLDIKVKVEIE